MLLPVKLIALTLFTYSEFLFRWKYAVRSPRGQDCSYYCLWKKEFFSQTTAKKLLAKLGNSEILPSDGVIFYTEGSLCECRAGAGVFSDTLDIWIPLMHLAHLLRSSKQRYMQFSPVLTTVGARTCTTWRFVYVLIARLGCWLYTISSKLLHQCWLSLQDLSNNNRVRLFWVPVYCDIK
jgi:hypothetical protein